MRMPIHFLPSSGYGINTTASLLNSLFGRMNVSAVESRDFGSDMFRPICTTTQNLFSSSRCWSAPIGRNSKSIVTATPSAPMDHNDRLKLACDAWHITTALSHEELTEQIRRDRIDILIDVAMHMAHNRLLTFARKPAPVQVAWLAYPGGTGLDAMDYRITDPSIDPIGGDESCYSEKSIRSPQTWVCYDPLSDAPAAMPRTPGPIRFGSINNPCKLNEPTLKLWSNVLRAVPNSRLIVQSLCQEHRQTISRILESTAFPPAAWNISPISTGTMIFASTIRSISASIRFRTMGSRPRATRLEGRARHHPAGPHRRRQGGEKFLANVGLHELIAENSDWFIEIAATLAADPRDYLNSAEPCGIKCEPPR